MTLVQIKRVESSHNEEELPEDEYDEAIHAMRGKFQKKIAKKPYNPSEVKRLLDLTQKWITIECPLLSDILINFPFCNQVIG